MPRTVSSIIDNELDIFLETESKNQGMSKSALIKKLLKQSSGMTQPVSVSVVEKEQPKRELTEEEKEAIERKEKDNDFSRRMSIERQFDAYEKLIDMKLRDYPTKKDIHSLEEQVEEVITSKINNEFQNLKTEIQKLVSNNEHLKSFCLKIKEDYYGQ